MYGLGRPKIFGLFPSGLPVPVPPPEESKVLEGVMDGSKVRLSTANRTNLSCPVKSSTTLACSAVLTSIPLIWKKVEKNHEIDETKIIIMISTLILQ